MIKFVITKKIYLIKETVIFAIRSESEMDFVINPAIILNLILTKVIVF